MSIENASKSSSERKIDRNLKMTEFPPQLFIGIHDGYCNLRCPCCFVHSIEKNVDPKNFQGVMPIEKFAGLLEEAKTFKPLINPYWFSEPLMNKNLRQYYQLVKEKDLPLITSTNGLLLTRDLARFFVEIKMDAISFSIDAFTGETLKKVRGIEEIDKIRDAVFMMLEARGDLIYPRIGVSFVLSEENKHEKDDFIAYWLKYVDVIRINPQFDDHNRIKNVIRPEKRVPCYAIYNKMVIDYKGDVVICTTDAFKKITIGNVFKSGIAEIWRGTELSKIRHYHETGQLDNLPLCQSCDLWTDHQIEESIENGIMVRKSCSMDYYHYNRLDRMANWKKG